MNELKRKNGEKAKQEKTWIEKIDATLVFRPL